MAAKHKTLSKTHKEGIRQAAIARYAARKAAAEAAATPAPPDVPYVFVDTASGPPVLARVVSVAPAPPAPTPLALNNALVAQANEIAAAQPTRPLTPRETFTAWLRGGPGRDACDTRLPADPVRLGAALEDRLLTAWMAGYAEGRAK